MELLWTYLVPFALGNALPVIVTLLHRNGIKVPVLTALADALSKEANVTTPSAKA